MKGKLFGDVFVTAQADTGESSIGELFTNFLDKDPSKLIDRIDDDRTYTTFGDDSTITDETRLRASSTSKWRRAAVRFSGVTSRPTSPGPSSRGFLVPSTAGSSSTALRPRPATATPTSPWTVLSLSRARSHTGTSSGHGQFGLLSVVSGPRGRRREADGRGP